MARVSKQNLNANDANNGVGANSTSITKVKRTRKSIPRDSPPQRSSIYRGVTRHRWTGRYEAHLWDKNCWNESQNKKGRQVYLGAYDDEEAAARAYDLAALKYWGQDTILNFPVSTYHEEMKEMEGQAKEEYIGSLRRKSSGFSRGVSKYRGVARHHHNGRWEARIGRVFGNKYLYLGTYATQEEAATAYDMAAIEYRGINAVTNFDLSRYIKWLRPSPNSQPISCSDLGPSPNPDQAPSITELGFMHQNYSSEDSTPSRPATQSEPAGAAAAASSALGLLLQSSKFKEMLERTSAEDYQASQCDNASPESGSQPRCSFPEDIQTYFECHDAGNYVEDVDIIFGDLNSFEAPLFVDELIR